VAAAAACSSTLGWRRRGVVGWDVAATVLLALVWPHIATADAERTRHRAADEDPGRKAVFFLAVASSLFSLFAGVTVLRGARSYSPSECVLWSVLGAAAVALAWLVNHTAYTLRYAHLYYRGDATGGLAFPGPAQPAELDFAYFAFTIGMCFQVSDVAVTSPSLRRTALAHALLSFVYNTTILALALNLLLSFLG
jgi:uncharacterized membrane protein